MIELDGSDDELRPALLKFKAQGTNTAAMLESADSPKQMLERIMELDDYQRCTVLFHLLLEDMRFELEDVTDPTDLDEREQAFLALLKGYDNLPWVRIDELPTDTGDDKDN
jgi:hypothetical protein